MPGPTARHAACAEVEEEGARISIIPTENLGPEDGFRAETAKATLMISQAPYELGALTRGACVASRKA